MSIATLKKALGEAGAWIDESYEDADRLYEVLLAFANQGDSLSIKEATPTTGIKASIVLDVASRVGTLYVNVGTAGSSGQTDVRVRKNGTLLAAALTVTVDNADPDGTSTGVEIDDVGASGDLYEIDFTAVATGAANVTATLRMKPITVEP